MPAPPRVLIVGHDASRSGAPRALDAFLRWLARGPAPAVEVLLGRGGPALAETAALAPSSTADRAPWGALGRLLDGLDAVGAPSAALRQRVQRGGAGDRQTDVVVANTLAALPLACAVAPGVPLVCWVHELDGVADRVLPTGPRAHLVARVDQFVAAGGWVAAMLAERWGVAPERVTTVSEPIDPLTVTAVEAAAARDALGLGDGPLVLGVGTAGARKGTDAFLAVVAALGDHPSRPVAAWVGGDPASGAWAEARHDVAAAGLGHRVRLLPSDAPPFALMAAAAVVLSTAREDPCPLTALEAGLLGTPVAAFAAGGAADLLRAAGLDDLVVPALDVLALADRVGALIDAGDGPDLGRRLGEVVRWTSATAVVAPAVWSVIEACAAR